MVATSPTHALVLAGGGIAGIAWELGVLRGIADADPDLAERVIAADVVVGTSAGSVVGAQVTSGTPLEALYDAQLAPPTGELAADLDLTTFGQRLAAATEGASSAAEVRRAIGAFALATETVPESSRIEVITSRLPSPQWPERDLRVVTVDAESGERVAFDRDSGVGLVPAVAASCAVPGVWPPVTIDGHRYVDGGVHSGANADLAAGAATVLVLSPTLEGGPTILGRALEDELVDLGAADILVVHLDAAGATAFGTNPLDPATRRPSAEAGRALGARLADRVRELWG